MGAPQGSLNAYNWKKIGEGALIAMGGALLVYLGQFFSTGSFGSWTPILTALSGILVNFGHQLLSDTN